MGGPLDKWGFYLLDHRGITLAHMPTRTVTTKGGHARELTDSQRRFAPFTMPDPVVHDGAIYVFTISEMRSPTLCFRLSSVFFNLCLCSAGDSFASPSHPRRKDCFACGSR